MATDSLTGNPIANAEINDHETVSASNKTNAKGEAGLREFLDSPTGNCELFQKGVLNLHISGYKYESQEVTFSQQYDDAHTYHFILTPE